MKKYSKLVALLLAAVLIVAAFAACTNDGSDDKDDTDPSDEAGKLIVATNAEFPPYEYKDGDSITGIDVEIMHAIATDLGMELSIVDMEFDSIIPAIKSGKANIGAAGMTVTEDRLKNVDFTDTYTKAKQVIIVKEGSDIKGVDDLEGKQIGVQQGTTGDIYITDEYGDDAVQRFSKGFEAVQSLTQNKVDAVVIDNEPAKVFVKENEGIVILDEEFADEDYAFAIAKDNTELLDKVNASLKKLKDSGELQAIIDKYIKAD